MFGSFFGAWKRNLCTLLMLIGLLLAVMACSDETTSSPNLVGPSLLSIAPDAIAYGDTNVSVSLSGERFIAESVVLFDGEDLPTTFIDSENLSAVIPTEALIKPEGSGPMPRQVPVKVSNAAVGGASSWHRDILLREAYAVPVLDSLSTSSLEAGGYAASIQIYGSGFVNESQVVWDGETRNFTYVDSTELSIYLNGDDFASGGDIGVQVRNPLPGGGPSNVLNVTVEFPEPDYWSHEPVDFPALGNSATISIEGRDFFPASQVQWNGEDRPTSYVSHHELTFTLTESDLAQVGSGQLTVVNPSPGGGQSEAGIVSIYREIGTDVTDHFYDVQRAVLYLAIGEDGGEWAHSVVTYDPVADDVVAILAVDNDPSVLEMTSDGQYLYIGQRGDYSIRRHHLDGGEDDLVFPVGQNNVGQPMYARDIVPLVGNPGSIAVSCTHDPEEDVQFSFVVIFDEGVRRPVLGPFDGSQYYNECEFLEPTPDPLVLVGGKRTETRDLKEIVITADGAVVENADNPAHSSWSNYNIHTFGNVIYADGGSTYNATTLRREGSFDASGCMTVDVDVARAYFLSGSATEYTQLAVFTSGTRVLLGTVFVEQGLRQGRRLVKVGSDGLAFVTTDKTMRLYRNVLFGP